MNKIQSKQAVPGSRFPAIALQKLYFTKKVELGTEGGCNNGLHVSFRWRP